MASAAEVARSLKIKASTLTRLAKEFGYYQAEADKEKARMEVLKAGNADPHDLRQAENVAAESAMMVPDTRQRLESALADLQAFVSENEQEALGSEELAAAKAAIASVAGMFA